MKIINLLLIFSILVLSSCQKPYSQYYHDISHGADISKYIEVTTEPKLFTGNDVKTDVIQMIENNYVLLGYSSFYGRKFNENQAIDQAKKVKASMVIVYTKYRDTISGYAPLILPDIKTSLTNVTASAYGSSGYATGYGTGTTTSYGTQTMYIPYNIDRFDQGATYWAKRNKLPILGAFPNDLSPDLKRSIGSNKGILVIAVIKQSPAYQADIINGDILKKINNNDIDMSNYQSILRENAGKKVTISIIRNGKEITKEILLNQFSD
jgi:membrane-associated protease RseP (regulator of RpoE activity)